MLGSVALCVLVALAAWSAVRQVQDARDSSAAWDPLDGEIPEGAGPPTPVIPGDPYVPVPPGEEDPPEDAVVSEEQIRAAFTTAFDQSATPEQWLAVVNAPVETGERLKTLAARCGNAKVVVKRIAFRSPQEAAVEFGFQGSMVAGGDTVVFGGGAERVAGRWMVTDWTIDKIIATAGPFCQ